MKKTILSLIALLAFSGSALAGEKPVISVPNVEVMPGQTASFTVNLLDGKADTYTSMTLYAQFPTTGFTTKSAKVSDVWEGTSASVGAIGAEEPGLATIPFASENPIPGSAVDNLVTVSFTVTNDCPVGDYEVTLKGTKFEYNTSDKDYADDVTFTITVTNRLTLDEASTVAPAAQSGVNVKVKRTIKANEWSTLCLPFDLTKTQFEEIFGNDAQLAFFKDYDVDKDGSDVTALTINFESDNLSEGFSGNYPYLIKTSKDITEFNVDGVNIAPDDIQESWSSGKGSNKKSGKFIGTYKAETIVPAKGLFLSGNKFYYSVGTTKMKAFRAYFSIDDVLASYTGGASAPVFFSINDGTTGITTIKVQGDDAYYDLNGRKVLNPKKGIYIHNGKKEVVK